MTITQLSYIIALDRYRHYINAAKHLEVSQPALTSQIQKLENELEVKLFDRNKKPLEPTEVGEKIIAQARLITQEIDKIYELAHQSRGQPLGDLCLGCAPSLAPFLIPYFVRPFQESNPEVGLEIRELSTREILQELNYNNLDAGLLETPQLQQKHFRTMPLFRERLFLYLSPQHPLYERSNVKLEDLDDTERSMLNDAESFWEDVMRLATPVQDNATKPFYFESNSLSSLKWIVDRHGGFTILPELALQELPPRADQMLKRFDGHQPKREISLVTHRAFLKQHLLEELRKVIQDNLPEQLIYIPPSAQNEPGSAEEPPAPYTSAPAAIANVPRTLPPSLETPAEPYSASADTDSSDGEDAAQHTEAPEETPPDA
jgi:LysR family hydrogen peroxide-inducible transcriptional activator